MGDCCGFSAGWTVLHSEKQTLGALRTLGRLLSLPMIPVHHVFIESPLDDPQHITTSQQQGKGTWCLAHCPSRLLPPNCTPRCSHLIGQHRSPDCCCSHLIGQCRSPDHCCSAFDWTVQVTRPLLLAFYWSVQVT